MKSLRDGGAQLGQAYAEIRDGEAWLVGASISEYAQGNIANHRPERDRKLLLQRREIDSLYAKVREKGLTLVPTRLYFKDGRVKVEIALARGKERIDKRRDSPTATRSGRWSARSRRAAEPPRGEAHARSPSPAAPRSRGAR